MAKRDGFCRPIFHDEDRQVVVREGRNIIVEQNSSTGSQYVANDVDFGDDGKAILLTGPNMGGKSCYLRQVNNKKKLESIRTCFIRLTFAVLLHSKLTDVENELVALFSESYFY